jgi:predicted double-glycine peptidase
MTAFKQWMRIPVHHIKVGLPSKQQTKNFSCGNTALRAIAVHFKVGPDSEQFYIDKCKTTYEKGTTPKDIIHVAKALGLNVEAKQHMSIEDLHYYLDQKIPVICPIQAWGDEEKDYSNNKNGHYVVAIGYSESRIYFMDPSVKGSRGFLLNKEFLSRWHDQEYNGKHYKNFGIAIWKNSSNKEKETLLKVKKIK